MNKNINKSKIREAIIMLCFLVLVTGLILYKVIFIANMPATPTFWTLYGIITTAFLISRLPYAYLHKDDHDKKYTDQAYPTVSIIIAAKDEEEGIYKTIETCINSKYPSAIECIVIDDGSTDGTMAEIERAQVTYGEHVVRLIHFPINKGKREAMSVGITEAKNDVIVFVDSDSFLSPDALTHITEHFLADSSVGAVSGNTKVENVEKNYLTKMQSIQYAISFDIYKASESVHQSVTCCPGCFSAYRRSALLSLFEKWKNHKFMGTKSTFGDDRGLTNYVLQDWKIVYCQKAQATTTVPEKFKKYWKQQLRWKKSWIREGLFAGTFMWKKTHPLASIAFYINFSFPILGPILAAVVLVRSIQMHNPLLFGIFIIGFLLIGFVYAMFVRLYYKTKNWQYITLFSFLYVTVFIWQMPYALFTLRNTKWGTR